MIQDLAFSGLKVYPNKNTFANNLKHYIFHDCNTTKRNFSFPFWTFSNNYNIFLACVIYKVLYGKFLLTWINIKFWAAIIFFIICYDSMIHYSNYQQLTAYNFKAKHEIKQKLKILWFQSFVQTIFQTCSSLAVFMILAASYYSWPVDYLTQLINHSKCYYESTSISLSNWLRF